MNRKDNVMNKRGLLESVVATVPVIIFLIIIMGLFVAASYLIAGYKGGGNSPGTTHIASDSFFMKEVSVNGKNVLVAEQMINELGSKLLERYSTFSLDFKRPLTDFVSKDPIFNGKQSCLFLAVANPEFIFGSPGVSNNADKIAFIVKDANGYAEEGAGHSSSIANSYAVSSNYIPIVINGNEKVLLSYYGDCLEEQDE